MKKLALLLVAAAGISLTACSTVSSTVGSIASNPATIKSAAQTATTLAITQFGLNAETTNYLYAVAKAVRTVSAGQAPDVADLTAALNLSITGSQSATLNAVVVAISSLYASYYAALGQNTKQAFTVLEAISEGVEAAAAAK